MSEIASIHAQVETLVLGLGARVRRLYDALEHLRAETLTRFSLLPAAPSDVDRWLDDDRFADVDGFFQSASRLETFRAGGLPKGAVTQFWPPALREHPDVRARLFALRDIGPRLAELQRSLEGVAWIYYQDVTNTATVFPYFDLKAVLPPDFNWATYHTFVSVDPAHDPERAIRWTPPNIDYGGEGLITSVSIPIWIAEKFTGLWSIDVPLGTLHRDVIREHVAAEQRNFIVDFAGQIVAHETVETEIDKAVGSILRKHLSTLGGGFASLDVAGLVARGHGQLDLVDRDGDRLVVIFRVVPDLEWLFFATFPKKRMLAAIHAQVLEAFHRIGRGDLSYRIDPTLSEEMEHLVNGCNAMSAAVQETLAARERAERSLLETVEQLRAAKATAEEASAAKDVFIAALSHELRTPLTPVLVAVDALQRDPRTAGAQLPTLELIRRNVLMEKRLIDDLLDVSSFTRGKMPLVREVADVHELIEQARDTCLPLVESAGLTLAVKLGAAAHHVDADAARLQQVFWNLLRNAVKYTPRGGHIDIETSNAADSSLVVEVRDTGLGVDAADLEQIFQPFMQGRRAGGAGGLGLGLTIAKGLVDAHDGRLTVSSEGPGRGATFRVSLTPVPEPAPRPPPPLPVEPDAPAQLSILVVEDNEDTLEMLQLILESLGHDVQVAVNATDALATAEKHRFDLVISDLGLPDLSGHELMRRLQQQRPVEAIAVSGYGRPEDVRESLSAGFRRHLTKPISLEQLEGAVADAARRRR